MRFYEIFESEEDLNGLVINAYLKLQSEPNQENYDEYRRLLKLRDEHYNYNPRQIDPVAQDDDYRGQHSAPDHTQGSPLYNVTLNGIYPEDFYGPNGQQYYGDMDDPSIYSIVYGYKNKPNARLIIYRSIPDNLEGRIKINVGDWVALTRRYVVAHGRAEFKGKFKVLTRTVAARDIFTNGDSLQEWGYDPQPPVKRNK